MLTPMANGMTVIAGQLAADYLQETGGDPGDLATSRVPSAAEVRAAFDNLGWPYDAVQHGDTWAFGPTDGTPHDFHEFELCDDAYHFRLGPDRGPFEIVRAIAKICGPQLANEHSGTRTSVVTEHSTYDAFVADLFD